MKPNLTKQKLSQGRVVTGVFLRYPNPGLAELLSYQGWDFCIFDCEHSTMGPADVENLCRAVEPQGVTALARVPDSGEATLLKYLDTGLAGVQVPWVESADQARQVVQAVIYQPEGKRGLAGVQAADYGQRDSLPDYIKSANLETLVSVQIESPEAVRSIDSICAEPGVDVVFLGPTDLSNAMGLTNQLEHPDVVADVDPQMKISCREIFGPAVAATPLDDVNAALALANDSEYGLGAGIFTRDANAALKFARETECGSVMINRTPLWRAELMPYGGFKQSGIGREGPRYVVEEMTELKTIGFHGIE
ncbi:MAG: aldehyde dehydrogenase family protein [Verrucomicrobiae bacterium]|nr:aldehyde dehydrogenase family protein [Verrucomicrobiae bacterium]